ncbi:MAG: carboxypeptidase regulatory-like domain-containing protein [Pyrinomonadaceae bacterium]
MCKYLSIGLSILLALTFSASAQPELDLTFNQTGKRTTSLWGPSAGTCAIVQPDNKIIVGGVAGNGGTNFVFVRYTADGAIDNTFGAAGFVETDIVPNASDGPAALALQSDGKIIAVGIANSQANQGDVAIVRYNSDGSLDTTFGSGGKIVQNVQQSGPDQATSVVVQPDGKIVVAGFAFANVFSYYEIVLRFNPDGSPDQTFGISGLATSAIGGGQGGGSQALSVALQADGKIVTAGSTRTFGSGTFWDAHVIRYHSNGTRDNTFDGDGVKIFAPSTDTDKFSAVQIQTDGKIVAGGTASGTGYGFYIIRMNPDGLPDNTFDGDGRAEPSIAGPLFSLVISPGGKINAIGSLNNDFALARFKANGTLDTSFSDDGKFSAVIEPGWSETAYGGGYDSVGRFVLGGNAASSLAVMRLRAPDTVGISGRVLRSDGTPASNAILFLANETGVIRAARTNPFGYYRFTGIAPGAYTVSVASKGLTYQPRGVNAIDELVNVDFMPAPMNP